MKKCLLFALVAGLMLIVPHRATAQDSRTIQGIVVDENGNGMAGASVILGGTLQGTTTDAAGRFSMRVPSTGNVTLEVGFLGYVTQNVTVGTRSDLRVALIPDATVVDAVIVTGMATIAKDEYVGAVEVIKMDDIIRPGQSLEQMLQGHVAGMSVLNTTGKVGGTPQIRIRGTSTIMGNQSPLWVVDGVIQRDLMPLPDESSPIYGEMENLRETAGSAISWLNPSDIETITVLKDASATAIYGSQASNGVIVITTKKATSPGLSVNYNADFSVGQKPKYSQYDLMNSQQQMRFQQEMWEDRDGYNDRILEVGFGEIIQQLQNKQITEEEYARRFRQLEMNNTDWFDLLFRNSFSQRHNISISGVGERVHSRFSAGLDRQNSEAKGNELMGLTVASSTTYRMEDKLIVDLQLSGSYRETKDFAFGVSPYSYAMNTSRTIPLYNPDGTLHYYTKNDFATSPSFPNKDVYGYNILNEMANTGARNRSLNLNTSLNVTVKIIENLQFRGTASYSIASGQNKSWATERSHYIAKIRGYNTWDGVIGGSAEEKASVLPFGGQLVRSNQLVSNYSFRGSVNYNRTFNDIHSVMLQLGAEASSATTNGNDDTRYGYLYYRGEKFSEVPLYTDPDLTDIEVRKDNQLHSRMQDAARVVNTKNNLMSQFFTAIYNYDQRYIMNFNARLDASNRFGQDHNKRFNPSWSLGVKWRLANERFMERTQGWLYNFDLSFSYGWRGTAVESVSPWLIANDGGLDNFYHEYVLNISTLPYPDLGWERKQDWNLGVDFSFFEGRLSATANVYGDKSHVMTSREVPTHNGVSSALIAGTVMENRGWEITVSATPVRTRDFSWSLLFNTSGVKNKMNNNDIDFALEDYLSGSVVLDGTAYGTFWAYDFRGLDPLAGRPLFDHINTNRLETPTTDPLDFLVRAGVTEPDLFGGLTTNFRYRNFNLSTSFVISLGAQTLLPAIYPKSGAPTPDTNVPKYMGDRWRKPGDEAHTDIPSIPSTKYVDNMAYLPNGDGGLIHGDEVSTYDLYNKSTIRVADSDFIRCGNISLRYNMPDKIANRIGARMMTIGASLSNPFVIAFDKKWEGRDPESGDWPARRMVSFSMNISF